MNAKKLYFYTLAVAACAFAGCAGRQADFRLTVVHVNDTHAHLAPARTAFYVDNMTIRAEAAGFPRLAARVADLRGRDKHLLFLHAGDVFQGTPYFTRYRGRADCAFLNLMGLDAMVPGNHEFDRGPGALADFASMAEFALVSANIDASREPLLRAAIQPYIIKEVMGRKVGIIGLTTPATPQISKPGPAVVFLDPEQAALQAVHALSEKGIHTIIILSHLGYEQDLVLAAKLPEVDIIAGGHSHTLLGDFRAVGLDSAGPYPTVRKNSDNDTVLIVQAWEWAKVVGAIEVSLDGEGRVSAWTPQPQMPLGGVVSCESASGGVSEASPEQKNAFTAAVSLCQGIAEVREDPAAQRFLGPYTTGIEAYYRNAIARVKAELAHVRMPGMKHGEGRHFIAGSMAAPVVADAMLWKARSMGYAADAALLNAGAVRTGMQRGSLTEGHVYEMLPFGDGLIFFRMRGREVSAVLESGLDRAMESPEHGGAFPYVAGLRYTADISRPRGHRLLRVELQDGSGRWRRLAATDFCGVVANSYMAGGGDGYDALAELAGRGQDTGCTDSKAFMDYARMRGELTPAREQRVRLIGH